MISHLRGGVAGLGLVSTLALVLGLASSTQAGILNMAGTTFGTNIDGSIPIANGTAWTLQAVYDDNIIPAQQGVSQALVTSLSGTLDGTPFTSTDSFFVLFIDPTNTIFPGLYVAAIGIGSEGISPIYTTSSNPGWSAANPQNTDFSGYAGTLGSTSMSFQSSLLGGRTLNLGVNDASPDAITTAVVPEPGTLVMGGLLAVGGGVVSFRRKRRKAA